jgi:molybdopterin molybdotransferase
MSETIIDAQLEIAMQVAHNVAPPTKIVDLALTQANGHVLAVEVKAKSNLPPFRAARVDGYAVVGLGPWQQIGSNLAGDVSDQKIADGQCIYIATGAALPQPITTVLKQEDCLLNENIVTAKFDFKEGENIRPIAAEAKIDEVLIEPQTKLTPALIGLAAAAGYEQVTVYEKPLVDVLICGDELIQTGPAERGKVRDSIGPAIADWITHLGGQLNEVQYVADDLVAHINAIRKSAAHLVITTGGTASGPVDFVHQAIQDSNGLILIDAVLVRPGYHQILAQLPDKYLIGLPGNPQSAVIGLLTMVRPFLAGSTAQKFPTFERRILDVDILAPEKEHRFVLCREIQAIDEVGLIEPVDYLDSSMLRGFVNATGYAIVEPGGQTRGAIVDWLPLPN